MATNVKITVNMALWGQDTNMIFHAAKKHGYEVTLDFGKKGLNLGKIIEGLWKSSFGDAEFPFKGLDIPVKSVTGFFKRPKKKDKLVMFRVSMGGLNIFAYHIEKAIPKDAKKGTKPKKAMAFELVPKGNITIDSIPGVNVKLDEAIQTRLGFRLASDAVSFEMPEFKIDKKKDKKDKDKKGEKPKKETKKGEDKGKDEKKKEKKFKKGFAVTGYLYVPGYINETFGYSNEAVKSTDIDGEKVTDKITEKKEEGTTPTPAPAPTPEPTPTPTPPAPTTKVNWSKLDKKIGNVVTFNRVGVLYENRKVSIFFDINAKVSVLEVGLIGLRLDLDLKYLSFAKKNNEKQTRWQVIWATMKKSVSFGLDGLALGFKSSSLTLAGLFAKQDLLIGGKEYRQYIGALKIETSAFSIMGLGAYGEIEGYKSFFAYGFLGATLGGPPFFLVEGIALGFGYNRQIRIPTIDKVADFPLVRMVMGSPDPDESVVGQMVKMIPMITESFPPKKDHLFFALGVKFSSFKLLEGFLLLIVSLGDKVRFDILGLVLFAKPKKKPFMVLEIALKATFIPADGILTVEGLLTDNSYLFSKNAKIQGGFAFYTWMKDVTINKQTIAAGDFVFTVGGFHPRYRKPAHYPSVPRFGLNWQVTDHLSIKALAYVALTPTCIMAGAELSAIFDNKDGLKAWFVLGANFLIQWNPFYYDIDAKIEIGIRYETRFKTFNLDLGASINVWGPKFSGRATVKCGPVKKTIKFGGAAKGDTPKIDWATFRKEFLPSDQKSILPVRITEGVERELKKEQKYIVNPKNLVINLSSLVPVSKLTMNGKTLATNKNDFGLYPVKRGNRDLAVHSTLDISVKKDGKVLKAAAIFDLDKGTLRDAQQVKKNLPAAMWSSKDQLNLNSKETTVNALVGGKLKVIPPTRSKELITGLPQTNDTNLTNAWKWNAKPTLLNDKAFIQKKHFGYYNEAFVEEISTPNRKKMALRATPMMVKDF